MKRDSACLAGDLLFCYAKSTALALGTSEIDTFTGILLELSVLK